MQQLRDGVNNFFVDLHRGAERPRRPTSIEVEPGVTARRLPARLPPRHAPGALREGPRVDHAHACRTSTPAHGRRADRALRARGRASTRRWSTSTPTTSRASRPARRPRPACWTSSTRSSPRSRRTRASSSPPSSSPSRSGPDGARRDRLQDPPAPGGQPARQAAAGGRSPDLLRDLLRLVARRGLTRREGPVPAGPRGSPGMTPGRLIQLPHVAGGIIGLVLGPVAMTAWESRASTPGPGRSTSGSMLLVCVTAAGLAVLDWTRNAWFLPVATGSYAFALVGYVAAKRRRPGWLRVHVIGQGGSYIAMVTALLVVNWAALTGQPGRSGLWPWLCRRWSAVRSSRGCPTRFASGSDPSRTLESALTGPGGAAPGRRRRPRTPARRARRAPPRPARRSARPPSPPAARPAA